MPNNCLSVLYKRIIQVENKNVELKVGGTNIPLPPQSKKWGGTCPPCPPPRFLRIRFTDSDSKCSPSLLVSKCLAGGPRTKHCSECGTGATDDAVSRYVLWCWLFSFSWNIHHRELAVIHMALWFCPHSVYENQHWGSSHLTSIPPDSIVFSF